MGGRHEPPETCHQCLQRRGLPTWGETLYSVVQATVERIREDRPGHETVS